MGRVGARRRVLVVSHAAILFLDVEYHGGRRQRRRAGALYMKNRNWGAAGPVWGVVF